MPLAPKVGAPVLTNATAEDKTTVTGLYGKWTQIKLERKLIAYIPTKEKSGSLASAGSASGPTTGSLGTAPGGQCASAGVGAAAAALSPEDASSSTAA